MTTGPYTELLRLHNCPPRWSPQMRSERELAKAARDAQAAKRALDRLIEQASQAAAQVEE